MDIGGLARLPRKCITIHHNGDFGGNGGGKVLYVQPEWEMDALLNATSSRLDMVPPARRLFNADGIEIEDVLMIEDGAIIFVSSGGNFLVPTRSTTTNTNNNHHPPHPTSSSSHSSSPFTHASTSTSNSNSSSSHRQQQHHLPVPIRRPSRRASFGKGLIAFSADSNLHDVIGGGGGRSGRTSSISSSSNSSHLPPVVGGYVIGNLLGKGGFGEVRLGQHQLTHERVAMKFLPKAAIIASMGAAERATTEIQCLMALNHPNVIRLAQAPLDTQKYMVMVFELMEGGDLLRYISSLSTNAMTEEETRHVFHQIVSAVSYAHNKNICHRDLKLENVLLATHQSTALVKIADFGLSDFYPPGATRRSQCGSFPYLAPEVFRGTSNAGPPIDIWALGVILFAMLCGRLPFEAHASHGLGKRGGGGVRKVASPSPKEHGDEESIIKNRIIKGQYKMEEGLSSEAKDLIRKMLKVDPAERAAMPEITTHAFLRKRHDSCTTTAVGHLLALDQLLQHPGSVSSSIASAPFSSPSFFSSSPAVAAPVLSPRALALLQNGASTSTTTNNNSSSSRPPSFRSTSKHLPHQATPPSLVITNSSVSPRLLKPLSPTSSIQQQHHPSTILIPLSPTSSSQQQQQQQHHPSSSIYLQRPSSSSSSSGATPTSPTIEVSKTPPGPLSPIGEFLLRSSETGSNRGSNGTSSSSIRGERGGRGGSESHLLQGRGSSYKELTMSEGASTLPAPWSPGTSQRKEGSIIADPLAPFGGDKSGGYPNTSMTALEFPVVDGYIDVGGRPSSSSSTTSSSSSLTSTIRGFASTLTLGGGAAGAESTKALSPTSSSSSPFASKNSLIGAGAKAIEGYKTKSWASNSNSNSSGIGLKDAQPRAVRSPSNRGRKDDLEGGQSSRSSPPRILSTTTSTSTSSPSPYHHQRHHTSALGHTSSSSGSTILGSPAGNERGGGGGGEGGVGGIIVGSPAKERGGRRRSSGGGGEGGSLVLSPTQIAATLSSIASSPPSSSVAAESPALLLLTPSEQEEEGEEKEGREERLVGIGERRRESGRKVGRDCGLLSPSSGSSGRKVGSMGSVGIGIGIGQQQQEGEGEVGGRGVEEQEGLASSSSFIMSPKGGGDREEQQQIPNPA